MLIHQLLKVLKRAVHARIVNVSSEAHRKVNVYDLKAVTTCQTEFRSHFTAYGVSKLAINLFTRHLAKKLARKYIRYTQCLEDPVIFDYVSGEYLTKFFLNY